MPINIIFIGSLPPPVMGASNVNKLVTDQLGGRGHKVTYYDTYELARGRESSRVLYACARIAQCCLILGQLFRYRRQAKVWYVSLSGGIGLIFDLLYSLAAVFVNVKVVYHHHSYAYLIKYSFLLDMIVRASNLNRSQHIFLSDAMLEVASRRYAKLKPSNTYTVSNVSVLAGIDNELWSASEYPYSKSDTTTLGYLSNITIEKGALEFLEIARSVIEINSDIRVSMAGPCLDRALLEKILDMVEKYERFEYIGPVYGEDKYKFYSSVDVFIFPSKYSNEAEPLVIIEAALAGCKIISSDVGTIREMERYILDIEVTPISLIQRQTMRFLSNTPDGFLSDRGSRIQRQRDYINRIASNDRATLLSIFDEGI